MVDQEKQNNIVMYLFIYLFLLPSTCYVGIHTCKGSGKGNRNVRKKWDIRENSLPRTLKK